MFVYILNYKNPCWLAVKIIINQALALKPIKFINKPSVKVLTASIQ